ncbi:excisionase family DNA-binding protein [Microlunatus endophyticus]
MVVDGDVSSQRLLLRVEEAADRLGIGRSLMYRLVLSGEVESIHVGRLRRVPAECLEDAVERLRREQRTHDEVA